jgi:hypothetical protein
MHTLTAVTEINIASRLLWAQGMKNGKKAGFYLFGGQDQHDTPMNDVHHFEMDINSNKQILHNG